MRNLIMGIVGIVWGGFIVVSARLNSARPTNQAYATGMSIGYIFGILMLIAGILALISGIRTIQSEMPPPRKKKKKKKRRIEYDDE